MIILNELVDTLKSITVPRYYSTERGYQTEFYRILSNEIENKRLFPEETIFEAEVQKRTLDHYGITQRPDLLIHIPIETGLTDDPSENNFVNFAFKLNGNERVSIEDYSKLEEMFLHLNYELGIYINIGRYPDIYLHNYQGNFKDRIHEFSVELHNNDVNIKHARFINNDLVIEDL